MSDIEKIISNKKTIKTLSVLSCLFTIILIAAIGMLVFTDKLPKDHFLARGEYFWYKLFWCEILFIGGLYFGILKNYNDLLDKRQITGGAIPSIIASIIIAIILSYITLFISLFISNERIHIVFLILSQLAIIVWTIWKITFLKQAQNLQNDGIVSIPVGIKQPETIIAQLTIIEKYYSVKNVNITKKIKQLREKINYSLPRVGKISASKRYCQIVKLVDDLSSQSESQDNQDNFFKIIEEIDSQISFLIVELKQ